MKRSRALWASLLIVTAAGAGGSQPPAGDARVGPAAAEARAASDELTGTLKEMLQKELAAGGFDAAVAVCARSAQEKTREYRARTGRDIRRISLRVRNPQNAPDPFERTVLESFDRLAPDQRAAAEHVEVVRDGEGEALRYLKPIVTAPLCLTCHGPEERIPAAVRAVLAKHYPRDRATGFAAGDVRGAVSVRIPLAAPAKR